MICFATIKFGKQNPDENSLRITAVWRDWGFRLNLKMVLYLENLCLTEKSRIFNPQPRQAPRRQAVKKPHFFIKNLKLSYSKNGIEAI